MLAYDDIAYGKLTAASDLSQAPAISGFPPAARVHPKLMFELRSAPIEASMAIAIPIGMLPSVIDFCYKVTDPEGPLVIENRDLEAMRRVPSLQQLRVFEAVATLESVSAAAKAIHLTQPSVTQSVNQLERKVGAALLTRRRTGSYLTPAGAVLLPRVTRMLTQIRQALCEPRVGPPFADSSTVAALERKITDAQVRALIAISESVSFDEAARRLGITEPSLHRPARMLERVLRRTLYRRTAQGFAAAPAAAELARQFMVAAREIEYGIEEFHAESGRFVSRIVVGNIPHSDIHLLSAAINDLLAKFPEISVDVLDRHYNDLLQALRNGGVDLVYGVLRLPEWASDVEERFLFSNQYTLVARRDHPLRSLRKIAISDLMRYDWIMPPSDTPRRQALERMFEGHQHRPKVTIETTSMGMYHAVLSMTDRLSLLPYREVQKYESLGFAALPFFSHHLQRANGIAVRKDWQPTRVHVELLERLVSLCDSSPIR